MKGFLRRLQGGAEPAKQEVRFQYRTLDVSLPELGSALDELGGGGWEVVGMLPVGVQHSVMRLLVVLGRRR